jgi:Tfp pilus assembly protein PilV
LSAIPPTAMRHQRGTTLLEALIAFLVLSLGILTIGRVQTHLRLGSDIARQRAEAVRLGQEELENLRAFSVLGAASGARSYADITARSLLIDADAGYVTNAHYRLTRSVQASSSVDAKEVSVDVAWSDRSRQDQHIALHSVVAGIDPKYASALAIAPTGRPVKGAFGRSAWIPLTAKDLGDGRSAAKRVGAPTSALVFDNASGHVTATCSGLDSTLGTADLTSAALANCETVSAYLVSGIVRFSFASPPDAAQAAGAPLPIAMQATSTGGYYAIAPSCTSEPLKTVAYMLSGTRRVEAVPIDAVPASLGLASWTDSGDRYVGYQCLVYPLANGQWSGDTMIVPSGWAIGATSSTLRVCRFAADLDGSGAIDANAEHPAHYNALAGSLANQNFLVITGSQACPGGTARPSDGVVGAIDPDLSTVQHQP